MRTEESPTCRSRLATFSRWGLVLVGCFTVLGIGTLPSINAQSTDLPDTPAGRIAAAYIAAFNSGNNQVMQTFIEQHRASSYLERRPIKERLAGYENLRGIFGQLTPLRIALSLELQLTVLVDATKTDDVLVMRFQLEDEPPHRLAGRTVSGIENLERPDAYADYVATRAASVDDSLRANTIRSVARTLEDDYIYPNLGREMAEAILRHHSEGRYDDATRAGSLADRLTEDALAVSNDGHIWVEAQNPMAQGSSDALYASVDELRQENYHFRKVEVLPGNIGYVKFDMIHDDDEAQEIVTAALTFLARSDALVFDIRDNIGGEAADFILGYLLPRGTVYAHAFDRDGRRVAERSTPGSMPGPLFDADIPVYVLTSSRTGSAAESFAYTLKHLNRATIVGEVTRGMAHPSKEVVVNGSFRVSVPFLRSENVITGTDWEGTGVIPHIEVAEDRALEAAVEDALSRIGHQR